MNSKYFRILALFILAAGFHACTKKPIIEGEKTVDGSIKTTQSNKPDTTILEFPLGATTCLKFFSLLEAGENMYIIDREVDVIKTLQNLVRNFAKNKLAAEYGVNTGGVEDQPINKNDCSVLAKLASKVEGNSKIMEKFNETRDEFNSLQYIFDQILYYYFDSFDLVSGYDGHYTSEFFQPSPSLKSGLRMMVKADYYRNWARKVNGVEVEGRNPKYLYVEYSPEYLSRVIPKKTRIYKINGQAVEQTEYASSLNQLNKLKQANLTIRLWDESNDKYSEETTISVNFETKNRARQITYSVKNGIAYMQIPTFGLDNIDKDLLKSWIEQIQQNHNADIRGTIIDLRNNGGGRAYETAKILGMIFPENTIISHYIHRDSVSQKYKLEVNKVQEHFPMNFGKIVVLTNFKSASSSEVVAAAVKDYGAGIIVGEKTIGKGIGQHVVKFEEPYLHGEIALTNYYIFSPRGESWYMTGVIPDIEVKEPSQQEYVWNFSDVNTSLPVTYTNKPNVAFNENLDIPNQVSQETIAELREFRNNPANEPPTCKKNIAELSEEESCIVKWGYAILDRWTRLEPTN
jgi:C-terminal peptidase prc